MKEIQGYKGYFVTKDGKVFSSKRNRFMSINKHKNGYLYVTITIKEKRNKVNIHRLVAKAFVENKNNKPLVNHIDGNKENNLFSNLEWVTHKENTQHYYKYIKINEIDLKIKVIRKKDGKEMFFPNMEIASISLGKSKGYVSSKMLSNKECKEYKYERLKL